MSLNLNMGYYHIQVSYSASNLCTIIFPCGKYHYKQLTMVITNSPEIYQQKMNDLFNSFELIRAYIDDLLVLTKVNWTNSVQILELNLSELKYTGT